MNVVRQRDSLAAALSAAEAEVDELRNGASRLLSAAKQALDSGHFETARDGAQRLLDRHPHAVEAKEGRLILSRAQREIADRTARAQRARQDSARVEQARLARALSSVYRRYDSVREVARYYAKGTSHYVNDRSQMLLYIVKPDNGAAYLFFNIRYVADDWLFIQGYTIKVDDRSFEIEASGFSDVERDHDSGEVFEWYSKPAGTEELEIVRAVIASRKAVIRYRGRQYYHDHVISAAEKRGMQAVLDALGVLERKPTSS